jgi:hypothetical protein
MSASDEKPTGALTAADVAETPHIYANGFQLNVTNADMGLILKLDNQPVAVVHMSYTMAKTLHKITGDVVTKFEKAVGRDMLTTRDVDSAMEAKAAASATKKAPAKKKARKANGKSKK